MVQHHIRGESLRGHQQVGRLPGQRLLQKAEKQVVLLGLPHALELVTILVKVTAKDVVIMDEVSVYIIYGLET